MAAEKKRCCNNCGSFEHLWIDCDEVLNKDIRRENARMAHNSSPTYNKIKLEKWGHRKDLKREGQKMIVEFLVGILERKATQLELMLDNFNQLLPLELDEGGSCQKKNIVAQIKAEMLLEQKDLQAVISAGRGRAEVRIDLRDNNAAWDVEIFMAKVEYLQGLRDSLWKLVITADLYIYLCEKSAMEFSSDLCKFEDMVSEMKAGLESTSDLQTKAFQLQGQFRDLSGSFKKLEHHNYCITKRKLSSTTIENYMKNATRTLLKMETEYLKLRVKSLEERLNENVLCKICNTNEMNLRLVTEQGTCTHCLCSSCAQKLPWTTGYQCCPYCRERVVQEACVKVTII